jgi:hypothetical protein
LRAFRKPRHREGGILNEWRYQIGNHANLPESISQTGASQGGDAGYCFDETSEQ